MGLRNESAAIGKIAFAHALTFLSPVAAQVSGSNSDDRLEAITGEYDFYLSQDFNKKKL